MDTETGGLDPAVESILTLGMVVLQDEEIVDGTLIKIVEPVINAHPRALAVNGINLDTHITTGVGPVAAVGQVKEFLTRNGFTGSVNPAGHNVPFDVGFVKRLYSIAGVKYSRDFSYRALDTISLAAGLTLAGRLYGQRELSLDALCRRFGIQIRTGVTHEALEDARATAKLLVKLLALIRNPSLVAPFDQLELPLQDNAE